MSNEEKGIPKINSPLSNKLTNNINNSLKNLWITRPPSTESGGVAGISAKINAAVNAGPNMPAPGNKRKKNFDLTGTNSALMDSMIPWGKAEKQRNVGGACNDHLIESIPSFIEAPAERVFANKNNAWIVVGRDRPASRASGYGGRANTQCGSIDLVTGRLGSMPVPMMDPDGKSLHVDPSFELDAARIYISQKTDIDENFQLISTANAPKSVGRGSVGIKADTIRLVARENIRIVTEGPVFNSQGGLSQSTTGIDLVAGNVDPKDDPRLSVQPLVKGDNLALAMEEMLKRIEELNGIVDGLLQFQGDLNQAFMVHKHISPFYAQMTSPSPEALNAVPKTMKGHFDKTKTSLTQHKDNLTRFKANFLWPSGEGYINSRFNGTN